MGAWQEIVDYTVQSNTTSFTVNNFGTITKDDFVKVVLTIVGTAGGYIASYPNTTASVSGYNTLTNYHRQIVRGYGSAIEVGRANRNEIAYTNGANTSTSIAYIKISENGKYNSFANYSIQLDSGHDLVYGYTTSSNLTFNDPITSLTFTHSAASGIGTGSRIQIYKLAAEKVADITVASNTTQVDISNLSIDKDSEYLLVSDANYTAISGDYYLFVNDNTTLTNYYRQVIEGNGTSASANRFQNPAYIYSNGNNRVMSYTHIKLSNIGAYTFQSYTIRDYGTSSINLTNFFGSSTAENITSITKLNISAQRTDAIGSGSRFVLYKLY